MFTKTIKRAAAGLLLSSIAFSVGATSKLPVFQTPDLKNFAEAALDMKNGRYDSAMTNLRDSARFGNKTAQYSIGMMYIYGTGVERNWSRGHAWLKLSASHAEPDYVSARDQVFEQLDEAEKTTTEDIHRELATIFGDSAALERRENWVRKQRRTVTGSRVGSTAAVQVEVSDHRGYTWPVPGPVYFEMLEESYVLDFRTRMGEVTYGELNLIEASNASEKSQLP
ncbi:MAG: hypothetical protein AAF358_01905 [Pseudomonadota bacterium]